MAVAAAETAGLGPVARKTKRLSHLFVPQESGVFEEHPNPMYRGSMPGKEVEMSGTPEQTEASEDEETGGAQPRVPNLSDVKTGGGGEVRQHPSGTL